MKVGDINIPFKGGFKGGYIPIDCLIENKIIMDVKSFMRDRSQVKGCEYYCKMQISIGGKLHVTWHSSEILATFLEDCKMQDEQEGTKNFPIEECIVYVGEDRGYYFGPPDEESITPTEKELEKLIKKYTRRR